MKAMVRKMWCLALVAALVLQVVPVAFARGCDVYAVLNGVRFNLERARCIVAHDGSWAALQGANPYLDQAKRLVNGHPFATCYRDLAAELRRGIEKAKVQILWNDEGDALEIINRLLGTVDRAQANPNAHVRRSSSGAGALLAAPVFAGLGALLWGVFSHFNWGQVSGIGRQIRPTPAVGNPVLIH